MMSSHHQTKNLLGLGKFSGHPETESSVSHLDDTAGDILILSGDGVFQGSHGNAVVCQAFGNGLYAYLPLKPPADLALEHTRDGFDIILEVFSYLL